jgi:hypothetical protein
LAHGEHDAERSHGPDVEHGERECDAGDPVAGRRDRGRPEQEAKVALAERAETCSKRHGHGR